MPGFFVTDGPYQNDRAPNPRCCSNPGVLCKRCALLALSQPTANCFAWDGGVAANADEEAADVRDMTPPTYHSFDEKPSRARGGIARQGVVINGEPGDEMMIPPTWSQARSSDDADTDDDDRHMSDDVRAMTMYLGG